MTRRKLLACSLALAAPSSRAASPRDYPQWRGLLRDGSASAFEEPEDWPDALTLRWRTPVGEGYATPLVIGDAVYSFTRRGGDEVMAALDAATGEELWQTPYAAPYEPSQPAAAHGAGPKATPVFRDGRLFSLGVSGIVAAYDAAGGELLWRTDAPAEAPFFSAASSPLAEDDLVVAHPGNYGPLTAFDAASGAVRWTAGEGGFFASPILAEIGGVRQIVTVTQESVNGVSFPAGRLLWRHPWQGGAGGPTPVFHEGAVIVSGLNLGVSAFRPVFVEGSWRTETVWETKDASMYVSSPVVIDGMLVGMSHRSSGQLFAIDASDGEVLWLGEPRVASNMAIVKAGAVLFLLSDSGELTVARRARTGLEPLKRYTVAESATWAQPAISGNRIFVKDVASLALWTLDKPAG